MKKILVLTAFLLGITVSASFAGVKMKISDDTDIDLGFRLQSMYLSTDNRDGTTGDSYSDFFKGHNANIKAGYESLESDTNIGSSSEDTVNSFLVGFYITY